MELNFMDILTNKIFISAVASWTIAQIVKTIIYAITHKKISIKRLFGDGGMPSGHSATVTSMATSAALLYGFASPAFAIATVMAIIVMHDAMSVRREAGKHAKALNDLKKKNNPNISAEELFKEFLGHTPTQVVVGAILGFCIALAIYTLW